MSAVSNPVVIGSATLYLGDCLDVLPTLPMVDAVVTDPPYHGVKADDWDNQWNTDDEFIAWAGEVCRLIEPLCVTSASLYWFASPQMAARLEVKITERFRVLNNLVWDKSAGRKGVGGTGIDVTALRGYWTANTERIIFAEPLGSDKFAAAEAGYERECQKLARNVFQIGPLSEELGVSRKQIGALIVGGYKNIESAVAQASNWILGKNIPNPVDFELLRGVLPIVGEYEQLRSDFECGRQYFADLRAEFDALRRPFYLTADDEWGDVWRFGIDRDREHPTQKPLALMAHIVKASSRPGSVVLDPFMGSGTTGVAAIQQGRGFIGIERNPAHFEVARRRIEDVLRQPNLFPEALGQMSQEALL